jgi:hypothetical protein
MVLLDGVHKVHCKFHTTMIPRVALLLQQFSNRQLTSLCIASFLAVLCIAVLDSVLDDHMVIVPVAGPRLRCRARPWPAFHLFGRDFDRRSFTICWRHFAKSVDGHPPRDTIFVFPLNFQQHFMRRFLTARH